MPELPDVIVYCEALRREFVDHELQRLIIKSPFVLRTFEPDPTTVRGILRDVTRIGKRIVFHLDSDLALVIHLMIAGRFHLRKPDTVPRGKNDLLAFQFPDKTIMLTEASAKKRAALHIVGTSQLDTFQRGGLDVLTCRLEEFEQRLKSRNHTVKRALTDPGLFDGIGNAYSDEILHAARLSPVVWTSRLTAAEVARLYDATRETLCRWLELFRSETRTKFPEKVTAFRPEMAVHGKYGQACPACDTLVQRIRYASRETNYCPRCQTDGKLLSDRSLARLLKDDWPKTIEELEHHS